MGAMGNKAVARRNALAACLNLRSSRRMPGSSKNSRASPSVDRCALEAKGLDPGVRRDERGEGAAS
ncbi:hypothetical protein D9M72_641260 [compost metagenome]